MKNTIKQPPKVAIVCDWLTNMGGAERVILQLHKIFPDAPIYTSTYNPDQMPLFNEADVRTAWFQKLPKIFRKHQLLTLPRQWHFNNLKLRGYDIVVSASGAEAKAVSAPDGVHIDLCYTPSLYYWVKPSEYLNKEGSGGLNPIWRLGLKTLMPYVKKWDLKASKSPDQIYAISTTVQSRIKQHYKRDSKILYPPTDIGRFANGGTQSRKGFVIFGRQVQHKLVNLAISACNELQVPLTVIGNGPEHKRLVGMAGPTITFKQNVSDSDMVKYVSSAEAFIFPNEEDFGIVAVEAQAAGTPVLAYRGGGSLDTVVEGVTGEFFNEQTTKCLSEAIKKFNYRMYNRQAIIDQANKFSNEVFEKNIRKAVNKISKNTDQAASQ